MQTAGARAGEVLAGAPFDNGNVDARQRQLARQHQAGRARARDQDVGIRHAHQTAPVVRNGGFQPARVPAEEMSTRVSLPRVSISYAQIGAPQFLNFFTSAPYQNWA